MFKKNKIKGVIEIWLGIPVRFNGVSKIYLGVLKITNCHKLKMFFQNFGITK